MKTKLKWRLGSLPTPEEITLLLSQGVLTKEEAREILFSLETDEDRDKKSLQEEIKFLRELVQKLSNSQTTRIIETIREVEKPWRKFEWYQPYYYYVNQSTPASGMIYSATAGGTTTAAYTLNTATSGALSASNSSLSMQATGSNQSFNQDFTSIKTF